MCSAAAAAAMRPRHNRHVFFSPPALIYQQAIDHQLWRIQKSTDDQMYSGVMKPVLRIHVGPMLLQEWYNFLNVSE